MQLCEIIVITSYVNLIVINSYNFSEQFNVLCPFYKTWYVFVCLIIVI